MSGRSMKNSTLSTTNSTTFMERLRDAPDVVIAITVFNGGDAVSRCVESVLLHSEGRDVILVDDASSDGWTREIVDRFSEHESVTVVRHASNQGYTRTANHALELAGDRDVILLNSDTVVGPDWVSRLRRTAYSAPKVATVSAASDNAGAMSLPERGVANDWGRSTDWFIPARAMAASDLDPLEVPTAHGFCMYLRRDALDVVGGFDAESFPRGYGEENDLSARAITAGWVNLWDPRVFVHHERGTSFGTERDALIAAARQTLNDMHPGYSAGVAEWLASQEMSDVQAVARAVHARASAGQVPRLRVLYVIHRSHGGTPNTNLDLMRSLADEQESLLLEAVAGQFVVVSKFAGGRLREIERWTPDVPFKVTDTWHPAYAEWFSGLVERHAIDVVHVRHLINQPSTTVPEVCRALGVRLIYSTHDFYPICPSIHLLDENMKFCGGTCTPTVGRCTMPTAFVQEAPEPLKNGWVHEWQRTMSSAFDCATHVVATTNSAADLLLETFPTLSERLVVIEHGRDVASFAPARRGERRTPGPLRIAAPAMWYAQKGGAYVREIALELGSLVEWHILGHLAEDLGDVAVVHGRYERATMVPLMQEIDPDLVGIFSLWPETYSQTLTEAWAMGVPVISTDIGAVAERIRQHGGGLLVPLNDAHSAAEVIRAFARYPELIPEELSVPTASIRSTAEMAADYSRLYRS